MAIEYISKESDLSEIIEEIVDEVGSKHYETNKKQIERWIKRAITTACEITSYENLPKQFLPYVIDSVIEMVRKRGNEGMNSRSELGTNTTYSYKDMEESLKHKLKGKKNPKAYLGGK